MSDASIDTPASQRRGMKIFRLLLVLFFAPQTLLSADSLFVAVNPQDGFAYANPRGFTLRWSGPFDRYTVLFGRDRMSMAAVATNFPGTSWPLDALDSASTYFWQVIGIDSSGVPDTSGLWSFSTHTPRLMQYKFIPSEDESAFDTELDSKILSVHEGLDVGKTALLVMDFWSTALDVYPQASSNIISLVRFARTNGIPVVHLLHEGWQSPAIPSELGELVINISNYNNYLEGYLDQWGVTTLLVVGYGTGECVTISRVNSIHRISQRSPGKYQFILMKDCTEGGSQYEWGVNGVETRFRTSSLQDLFTAFGVPDTVYPTLGQVDAPLETRRNALFGTTPIGYDTCALVLLNTWQGHANDGFSQRLRENNRRNILPLLRYARAQGMDIIHVTNGRELDSLISVEADDLILQPALTPLKDKVRLWNRLKSRGITTLLIAGNFTNTTEHFPTLDAWGLSVHNNLPVAWPYESAFHSVFFEDCITVFETPQTIATGLLKKTYLSRATAYEYDHTHSVTRLQDFRRNVNTPPVIRSVPGTTVFEDSQFVYEAFAEDGDSATFGDVPRYRLSVQPTWLAIDTITGVISGAPVWIQAQDTVVAVEAYDDAGGIAIQQFSLDVIHVNHPPKIIRVVDSVAIEDSLFRYRVVAVDKDTVFGDVLVFRETSGPTWLLLDSLTGVFSGTPSGFDVGESVVTVEVDDGAGGVVSQDFGLKVIHTNHPPSFVSTPDTMAFEDSLYSYRPYATDRDSTLFGDRLLYRLQSGPAWLKFDSSSATFSGIPADVDVGQTFVVVQAIDDSGAIVQQRFSLQVLHVNHDPVIVSAPFEEAVDGSVFLYQVVAADRDTLFNDVLSYSITEGPNWLKIESAKGIVAGITQIQDANDIPVEVQVSDGVGGVTSQSFAIALSPRTIQPVAGQWIVPVDSFTVALKIPREPLQFVWPRFDVGAANHEFRIYGPGLDTTISGIDDTIATLAIMDLLQPNVSYSWTIKSVLGDNEVARIDSFFFRTSAIRFGNSLLQSLVPEKFFLEQNFPNPFNPTTTIVYGLPEESDVRLEIFNMLGQLVYRRDEIQRPGYYDVQWQGNDLSGRMVSSGVYIYRLVAKGMAPSHSSFLQTKKMILLK